MLRIKVDWGSPVLPEFDPVKHDPERTFAFLTYRGVNYAKWVYLKVHFKWYFLGYFMTSKIVKLSIKYPYTQTQSYISSCTKHIYGCVTHHISVVVVKYVL